MRYITIISLLSLASCGPIHMDASVTWGGGISSSKTLTIDKDESPMPAILPPARN